MESVSKWYPVQHYRPTDDLQVLLKSTDCVEKICVTLEYLQKDKNILHVFFPWIRAWIFLKCSKYKNFYYEIGRNIYFYLMFLKFIICLETYINYSAFIYSE